VLAILAAVAVAVLVIYRRGPSSGHDFDFHLTSWMDALDSWRHGNLYPQWSASANFGAGEPRFVYYPPLTWMMGALLGAVMPWQWVPLALTALILALCGLTSFCLAREWLPREAAALTAVLFITNPYLIFNAYERTAYGELAGAAFLPLVLLFAVGEQASLLGLTLSIAGVWFTNAPAALMASYLLLFVGIFFSIWKRSWKPMVRALEGGAVGAGLAGLYLVPAIRLQRWVDIRQALDEGMRIQDSWLFERTGQGFHDAVLNTASWIVVGVVGAALIAALILWRLEQRKPQLPLKLRPMFDCAVVTLAGIALLQFPVCAIVWRLPKLEFLQFPWRWMLVASLLSSLLLSALFYRLGLLRRWVTWVLILGTVSAGTIRLERRFYQFSDDKDAVSAQVEQHQTGAGVAGTDEYTAMETNNDIMQMGMPVVRVLRSATGETARTMPLPADGNMQYPQWKADAAAEIPARVKIVEWTSEEHLLSIQTEESGWAVLRLREFPAWRVMVNSSPARVEHRADGLLAVAVGKGTTRIAVSWQRPLAGWVGMGLSLFSLGVLLLLLSRRRRSQAFGRGVQ
jgi:uncharacterized membrane protein